MLGSLFSPTGLAPARRRRILAAALAAAGSLAGVPLAAQPSPEAAHAIAPANQDAAAAARRGISAYLASHYSDALPDLEAARAGGAADGSVLYMLAYCYQAARLDASLAARAWDEALETLTKEVAASGPSLDSWFYLSNLHLSRQDEANSRKTAEAGVAAIDARRTRVGKDGVSLFRAGKVHADAGRTKEAVAFHKRALSAFAKPAGNPPPEYLRRAAETLVRYEPESLDHEKVFRTWERLLASDPGIINGDWHLGIAALRAGRYEQARDAFERIRKAGGTAAQDAFYTSSLASACAGLVARGIRIPQYDAKKRKIVALPQEEIDTDIAEVAKKASGILSRPVTPADYLISVGPKGKKRIGPGPALQKEMDDTRAALAARAIVLASRGESLQAKAFEGGYAALLIQDWTRMWQNAHRELIETLNPPQEVAEPAGSEG